MRIKEFAERIGVTESTLRFYEKVGVLKPIFRNSSGYREFGEADLRWMEFVLRLKVTGMPLAQIVQYAQWRDQGDRTIEDRLQLLQGHELQVRTDLEALQSSLEKIQEKILYYQAMIPLALK